LNQKINPVVAVIVILVVVAGAGWLIYSNTQAHMVNLPYKSQAQKAEEAKQMAAGMMRRGSSTKAKPTGEATGEPKRDSQSGHVPKPEQKTTQEN